MSDKLISAERLSTEMYHEAFETDSDMQKWDSGCWIRYKLFENVLKAQPTVEAEPVRHGHWVENNGRYGWYCSQCKKENNYAYDYNENNVIELQDHYCPNCGAKMDEDSNTHNTDSMR